MGKGYHFCPCPDCQHKALSCPAATFLSFSWTVLGQFPPSSLWCSGAHCCVPISFHFIQFMALPYCYKVASDLSQPCISPGLETFLGNRIKPAFLLWFVHILRVPWPLFSISFLHFSHRAKLCLCLLISWTRHLKGSVACLSFCWECSLQSPCRAQPLIKQPTSGVDKKGHFKEAQFTVVFLL